MSETKTATAADARPAPAPETQRLYAGDWAAFADWCGEAGLSRLPADPTTVATYLESLAATHRYGALARRLAAIADRHARADMPAPRDPSPPSLLCSASCGRGRRARAKRHPLRTS